MFLTATYSFSSTLDDIVQSGVLKVGTTGDFPGWSFKNPATDEYEGFDIDVANKLGESMGVEVEFVATSNAGTLLTKIKLEGANSKADIVLGLDQNFLVEAENTNLFVKHEIVPNIKLDWDNQYFTPYDYGLFAFIYDETILSNPPKSMEELVNRNDIKIIVQDPRTCLLYTSDAADE